MIDKKNIMMKRNGEVSMFYGAQRDIERLKYFVRESKGYLVCVFSDNFIGVFDC